MISRPNFLFVAASFAGLLTVLWCLIGPSPLQLWQMADPVGYAAYRLRSVNVFTAPFESYGGFLDEPLDSWRVVALSPQADSVFRMLASDTTAVARLYGIAGVALRDPLRARTLAQRFTGDTTPVPARIAVCSHREDLPARVLADSARSPEFARTLLLGDARCTPGS